MDGSVAGECPPGYPRRLPQVQLFVRFEEYQGGWHEFSNEATSFHLDFMNGWQEGKLQEIIDNCEPTGEFGYNPECHCEQFLTPSETPAVEICPQAVKTYIINEEIDEVHTLPRGGCTGNENLVCRSWMEGESPPFVDSCLGGEDWNQDDYDGGDEADLDGDGSDMDGDPETDDPEGDFEGEHPEPEEFYEDNQGTHYKEHDDFEGDHPDGHDFNEEEGDEGSESQGH